MPFQRGPFILTRAFPWLGAACHGFFEEKFIVTHIKPARYDPDGYVIQWWKNCVPSNSLGVLYGLTRDCAERRVLGPDVDIEYSGYDEPNTVIPFDKVMAEMKRADGALLCIVGVQSNQFPRVMHIARRFRAAGIAVAIGGFHVSGCLAMLKNIPVDIQEAIDIGCIIFAGEAEEEDMSMTAAVDDREAFDALEMISTHGAAANRLQRAHIDMHENEGEEREALEAAE